MSVEPDPSPAPAPPAANYELATRTEPKRWSLFLNERGVTLANDSLAWSQDGETQSERLADLREVHLTAPQLRGQFIPTCRLGFSNGTAVNIIAAARSGAPDADQRREYAQFLADLHARLSPQLRSRISFSSGFSAGRMKVLWALVVGGVALTVLLAIIGLFAGQLKAFGLAIVCGLGTWRMSKLVEVNAPCDYDPDYIPEGMTPP